MEPVNLIYLVFQEVKHESTTLIKCFTLPYDACGYAFMLNEANNLSDVKYRAVAYELF